jgi:hypothetical protein
MPSVNSRISLMACMMSIILIFQSLDGMDGLVQNTFPPGRPQALGGDQIEPSPQNLRQPMLQT